MGAVTRWLAGGAAVLVVAGWFGAARISAATTAAAQASQTVQVTQGAEDTRREFREILEQLPPALGVVLKSDPTLLSNTSYLTPYPALTKYLAAHPEIARDPAYFLEHVETVQVVDYR